ncbi:DUF6261 family protein [Ancylomarina longa]|uniref:Uncharacterized protein n=1 Tax=Ancylomarina longa TaxID=2487017 RepID=A0A434AER4_9BACT|nr:DUF6261 family protein [Ancylomarina longa]RUT72828.1 hypothetical protein DLK05_16505 [Ancylomarina longa]
MEIKLLSNCTANEAFDTHSNCLSVLKQKDLSADQNLTGIVTKLSKEGEVLLHSIGIEKKSEFTQEISALDTVFDGSLICFKKFVEANMSLSEQDKVEKADKIWNKIEAKNPYLYKLGYEEQMTQALALFNDLDGDEYQAAMSDLHGVSESYQQTKTAYNELQSTYRKGQEVKALKENTIPSNNAKKEILDIINTKLLPYLGILADIQADAYGDTYTKITHYIELVNTKIRTRRSRAVAQEEANSEAE